MTFTTRIATVDDEFDYPLTERELFQIDLLARECPDRFAPDRVFMVTSWSNDDGVYREGITHGELIGDDMYLKFKITGLGVVSDGIWRPIPEEE